MLNISQGFYFPIIFRGEKRKSNLNIRQAFSKDVMYMNSLILILRKTSFKSISKESTCVGWENKTFLKASRGTKHIMYNRNNFYVNTFSSFHRSP